jgi:superfamily I DNA and/or RNA helicase
MESSYCYYCLTLMCQAIRKAIIREADVFVTTLSGCGGDIYAICMETFRENKKSQGASDDGFFSAVVIDEAGQVCPAAVSSCSKLHIYIS